MNNIEEELWNYIDGSCTPAEQEAIRAAIASNEAYRIKYYELLELDASFSSMEIDEPPMAFTYNVMETIRNEHALKPLNAHIDKRIIKSLTAFFIFTILALVVYIMLSINWSAQGTTVKMPVSLKLPDIKNYITPAVINAFMFFDVVLGLFLADAFMRRRNMTKHV